METTLVSSELGVPCWCRGELHAALWRELAAGMSVDAMTRYIADHAPDRPYAAGSRRA